jgi:acetyl-CoA acetyltransferase
MALQGKTVLITGAAQGLGQKMAVLGGEPSNLRDRRGADDAASLFDAADRIKRGAVTFCIGGGQGIALVLGKRALTAGAASPSRFPSPL